METEFVKHCLKHGDLTADQVIKSGKNKLGLQVYKCKTCMKIFHTKHYEKNKDKVNKACAIYRKENKEKVKSMKRESWLKHKHKYVKRENERKLKYKHSHAEHYRKIDTKRVEKLTDSYVAKVISSRKYLQPKDIPQSLIELKRILLKIKRKKREIEFDRNN